MQIQAAGGYSFRLANRRPATTPLTALMWAGIDDVHESPDPTERLRLWELLTHHDPNRSYSDCGDWQREAQYPSGNSCPRCCETPVRIPMPTNDSALLTVRDVARRLSVSAACVYALVERRQIPYVRIGNRRGVIRFRPDDVETWLTAQRVERDQPLTKPPRVRLKHINLSK